MRLWRSALATTMLLAFASCSKTPVVSVEVSTGQEKGSLSVDPKVVKVDIVAVTPDGKTTLHASAAPGGSFNLGNVPDNAPLKFCLTGSAADGSVVARGRSISVPIGEVALGSVGLFIQRIGGLARPDGDLVRSHVRGVAAVFQERFLLLTGGDSAADASGSQNPELADFYDLLPEASAVGGGFPRVAASMVVRGTNILTIDQNGATWTDLSQGIAIDSDVMPPDGFSFADVAGGRAIDTPSGATWIVGATRDGSPTASILVVAADSTLSTRTLLTPRASAAAAWIGGSLVVFGGNADSKAVEELTEAGTDNVLQIKPDPTTGAAIAQNGDTNAVLIGGSLNGVAAPTRIIDLACKTEDDCVPSVVDTATINTDANGAPLVLTSRTQAFTEQGGFIAVGDDATGQTHAFRVITAPIDNSPPSAVEMPLREPRIGATAIPAPNGTLMIMGGQLLSGGPALSIESYFPNIDGTASCLSQ